jgi:hypothetical protein
MGDLNAGAFFIRINQWAMKLLIKAMAFPMLDPGADLGALKDQNAIARVLNESDFRKDTFYEPRLWFNALRNENEFEGKAGDFLVQVPNSLGGGRWKAMSDILLALKETPDQWAVTVADTRYEDEIKRFWTSVKDAMVVQHDVDVKIHEKGDEASEELKKAAQRLKDTLAFEPDRPAAMEFAISKAKEVLKQ